MRLKTLTLKTRFTGKKDKDPSPWPDLVLPGTGPDVSLRESALADRPVRERLADEPSVLPGEGHSGSLGI